MRLSGMMLPLLMLTLTSVGCGKAAESTKMPDRYLDTRLQFYLDEFVADAHTYGVNVNGDLVDSLRVMKFVPDVDEEKLSRGQQISGEPGTIGTCASFEEQKTMNTGFKTYRSKAYGWNEVWIDDDLYSSETHPLALKELIYHELGHCLLNLEHAEPKPHAIMSPEMSLNGKWLTSNWDGLVRDFFSSVK